MSLKTPEGMDAFVKNVWNLQHYEKNAFEKLSTSFNDHGGCHIKGVPLGIQYIKVADSDN